MSEPLYYLLKDGQESGPHSLAQLQAMWAAGTINSQTLWWTEGMGDWQPFAALEKELQSPKVQMIPGMYYLLQNGRESGPFYLAQLQTMRAGGTINAESLWRTCNSGDWSPLAEIEHKFTPPKLELTAQSLTPAQTPATLAWYNRPVGPRFRGWLTVAVVACLALLGQCGGQHDGSTTSGVGSPDISASTRDHDYEVGRELGFQMGMEHAMHGFAKPMPGALEGIAAAQRRSGAVSSENACLVGLRRGFKQGQEMIR